MFKLEPLIALMVDFIRTLLIEVVSDRVSGLRTRGRMRGMKDVRRRLHRTTRRRLLHRLSPKVRR